MPESKRTRVKICGITRIEDAQAAAAAGADAIGLVFYEPSPRAVEPAQAAAIVASLPPLVSVVGLFVNAEAASVRHILAQVPLDLLQFHGDEDAAYCAQFARPWLKALRVRQDSDLAAFAATYRQARGLLLDAWHPALYGGSGEVFDWQRVNELAEHSRIILAGGLTPDNVAEAITTARPWAVDVSSGVETAPGLKSAESINAFMQEVQGV